MELRFCISIKAPWYTKCGPGLAALTSSGSLLGMRALRSHPDLLNHRLHFNKCSGKSYTY
jgi:hypothetical protein